MVTNNTYPHASRQACDFRYFDLGRHWNSRLRDIFESDVVQAQIFHDFSKFLKDKERRFNQHRSRIAWHCDISLFANR